MFYDDEQSCSSRWIIVKNGDDAVLEVYVCQIADGAIDIVANFIVLYNLEIQQSLFLEYTISFICEVKAA